MRTKFNLLFAALLLAVLALPQIVQAQTVQGGFSVSLNKQDADARDYVIMGGNNQKIGNIALTYITDFERPMLRSSGGSL